MGKSKQGPSARRSVSRTGHRYGRYTGLDRGLDRSLDRGVDRDLDRGLDRGGTFEDVDAAGQPARLEVDGQLGGGRGEVLEPCLIGRLGGK